MAAGHLQGLHSRPVLRLADMFRHHSGCNVAGLLPSHPPPNAKPAAHVLYLVSVLLLQHCTHC
jgi:hypothetical protein